MLAGWTAYWSTIDPATGKRRQFNKAFPKKSEAQAHLNSVLSKVDEGSWRPDKPLTVKELLEEHWLPAQRTHGLRASTIEHYEGVVGTWLVPQIGGMKVAALTPQTVTQLTEDLRTTRPGRKNGLSLRSTQMAVGTLKSACAFAVETGLIGRNPVAGVRRPKLQRKPITCWDNNQARQFLDATQGDRLSFAWCLLLARGLRRGELCGLRWQDIDLDAGVLRISRTRVHVDGEAIDSTPKTESGRRSIPLDGSLVAVLRRHKRRQAAEQMAAGPGLYNETGYLVADELGEPYDPNHVSKAFDNAVKAVGVPRIRLHDLRHTAASLMLAAGAPVKVVSDLLGHASPTITLATYAHTIPGAAELAGEKLTAALLG